MKSKTVRGGMSTATAQAARVVIGMATIPIFARLLEPEDFGLVAMVTVLTNFATMFVNSGFSTATVQRDEITHQQVSNLFWIAATLGTTVALITSGLAPLVGWMYGEPKLVAITIVLSFSFLFSGLSIQHEAMMRRGMQFHMLATTSLIAFIAGQTAGILWAWHFRGQPNAYWALVLIPVTTAATTMVTAWGLCHWRPSLPQRNAGTRELAVFGANLTAFSFVNYFARNADNLLIGLFWGKVLLGYYERAYRLLLLPLQQIAPPFGAVVIPALSRLNGDQEGYTRAYYRAINAFAWTSVPVIGWLACSADPLIYIYMGAKWEPVTPLLQALLPAAWANCIIPASGWAFTSSGRVREMLIWGTVHSVVLVIVMLACVPYGVLQIAWGVSIAYVVMRLPGFIYCFHNTPLSVRSLIRMIWYPTLIPAIAAAIAGIAHHYWLRDMSIARDLAWPWLGNSSAASELLATTLVFAIAGVGCLLAIPGALEEIRNIGNIARLSMKKPGKAQ
ncbi:lipopolysaccharide biosynthesis protein [Aeoliella mucimassa]|uniref:lipopolysaccharide biosynthesis protein n=1 Tax=Aeoliella mucimassa TaxID=2527972 RepID=UPI001E3EF71C|nr:lipopolysaccharide biosynthesis protein [Aeoliella mucimassa]